MTTAFSLTFDSIHRSLVVVAGERILADVTDIRITRTDAGYDCVMTRDDGGAPVRLVAAASPEGRQALERANGRISPSAPGFVEVTPQPGGGPTPSLQEHIAQCFGYEPGEGREPNTEAS